MIISPRLRFGQIIFIGALINCLSLNNPLITTIILVPNQNIPNGDKEIKSMTIKTFLIAKWHFIDNFLPSKIDTAQ